jgi:hypothetical protein
LARQEEAAARQEKAEADAKARHEKAEADAKTRHEEAAARQEKATAELKAAILASFIGSTTCQTETTSSSEEMEATNLEATSEATGHSGAAETPRERDKRRQYRVIGGPIWISTLGRMTSPMG